MSKLRNRRKNQKRLELRRKRYTPPQGPPNGCKTQPGSQNPHKDTA